jgi:hypothetical protein
MHIAVIKLVDGQTLSLFTTFQENCFVPGWLHVHEIKAVYVSEHFARGCLMTCPKSVSTHILSYLHCRHTWGGGDGSYMSGVSTTRLASHMRPSHVTGAASAKEPLTIFGFEERKVLFLLKLFVYAQ